MTDNELIKIFLPLIKNGMTAYGHPVTIMQSFQPTQQGAENGASLYFFKVDDKRIGHPSRKSIWDTLLGKTIDTDTQRMEATFQVNALVKQIPQTNQTQPTASDYLNVCSMLVQGGEFVEALRNAGIAILRVSEIRNPYFKNDKDQYEAMPSFDFTIAYNRTLIRDGKTIETIGLNVNRV